ncbi:MAG: hypothetical protein PQJ59_18070 [Spirochaetales bacterium]|nr:hypothetical protein [Spirochaetales bacterium]
MGLINGLALILLGAFCVPSLVAEKNEKAKELLDKITPYQGTFGLVVFAWGVWGIVSSVLHLSWLGNWPLWWATRLGANVINAAGGMILGFAMIQSMLLSRMPEEAQEKATQLREKLVSSQSKIGIAAIIAGIWVLVYEILLQGILNI